MLDFILSLFGGRYSIKAQVGAILKRKIAYAQQQFDSSVKEMLEVDLKAIEEMRLAHIEKKDRLLEDLVNDIIS